MITLSDYLSFLYTEVTRARINLDHYVAEQAQEFAKDEILKHFPVARFRIPEMELNIPVMIAGAKYKTTIRFTTEKEFFYTFIKGELGLALQNLKIRMKKQASGGSGITVLKPSLNIDIIKSSIFRPSGGTTRDISPLLTEFYTQLVNNAVQSQPENIVKVYTENLFFEHLKDNQITEAQIKPEHKLQEILDTLESKILAKVLEDTIVVNNVLKNLLVDPETHKVHTGSNEFSVFQIKAKINEEGLFVHSIKEGEEIKKIVEFE